MPQMNDVERVHAELATVRAVLAARDGPSDLIAFDQLATKTLLLCAASYFERVICSSLLETAAATGTKPVFRTFIEKQALERKDHTMFDWESSNANKFFGLFGDDFRNLMKQLVSTDDDLTAAVREFMFITNERNKLVHGNFAGISTDITFQEVWKKFSQAVKFAEWLPEKLREVAESGNVSG